MRSSQLRRTMAIFSMGSVMKLTDLTARQIRYYEEHELITPERTDGNRRLFSLNDIDRLLEIKDLIDQGINMAGIKRILIPGNTEPVIVNSESKQKELSDKELRKLLRKEMYQPGKYPRDSIRQGELSRFFH
nr:MerR family transcriptional regulator [Mangrovibacillus cuniculi]